MNIDALIAKYLSGETSPEEAENLNKWKQSSPENDLIFRRSEDAWNLAHTDRKQIRINRDKAWSGIHERIARRYSLPALLRVAGMAASVALLLGLALSHFFANSNAGKSQGQPQKITFYVPRGVCSKTILPDNTIVWLNASSSISYPSFFDGDARNIELTGEAFFDVARDETKPFIIHSGNIRVNVLGTSFNFKHYEGDTHAVLAVETGMVTLTTSSSSTTSLEAGQYATVDNRTLQTSVYDATPTVSTKKEERDATATPGMVEKEAQTNQFSSWRNYTMVFRDEPFINVLNELSRKYNAEFEIRNKEIMDYEYTATFDDMGLEDILKLLKISAPIDYTITSIASNTTNAYGKRKVTIFRK